MCIGKAPKPPAPVEPIQYAVPKLPDEAVLRKRAGDRLKRGAAPTQLTPAAGLGATDTSGKKTLLGL